MGERWRIVTFMTLWPPPMGLLWVILCPTFPFLFPIAFTGTQAGTHNFACIEWTRGIARDNPASGGKIGRLPQFKPYIGPRRGVGNTIDKCIIIRRRTIRDFATCWFRTLQGSLTSINNPTSNAIVRRQYINVSLHKRWTLSFSQDISDTSVIYPMGRPICFCGYPNNNILLTLLIWWQK